MKYNLRCLFFTSLAVMLLFVNGCGNRAIKTEKVTGTVTLDGVPLEGAMVGFNPKVKGEGHAGYAVTDSSGRFILQTQLGAAGAGTTLGEYAITVTKSEQVVVGKTKNDYGQDMETKQVREVLPLIYANPNKTPFSAKVEPGENDFKFELDSKTK